MKRAPMTEKAIQAAVLAHWRVCGVEGSLVAAIPNARAFGQPGLTKGLFDLMVIGGNVTLGFLELKTETGKLSDKQEAFKLLLISHNIPYAVTHGREQPIRVLEDWGVVRKQARGA